MNKFVKKILIPNFLLTNKFVDFARVQQYANKFGIVFAYSQNS